MDQGEQSGGEEQTTEHRLQQEPVAAAPERVVTGIFPNADQTGYGNRIEYRSRIEYDHAGDGIHHEILVEAPRQPEIRSNENLASKANELLKYGNTESRDHMPDERRSHSLLRVGSSLKGRHIFGHDKGLRAYANSAHWTREGPSA
jgi:hypothetical protein